MGTNQLVPIKTRMCIVCGRAGQVNVSAASYDRYRAGAHVQDAFPQMSAGLREQLITGTHPDCWDELFVDLEEE